jgi:hypothetical protein
MATQQSVLELILKTIKTGEGIEEAERELAELNKTQQESTSTVKESKFSWTELKSAIDIGKQAFQAVAGTVQAVIGPVIDYGKQVRDLSAFTGAGAEDSSELIQVLDDLGVEYGTLRTAAKSLTENGLQPNLKTLAELAEQYNAIQDPVERSQFLIDQFGARAGPQLAFALEQGKDALLEMGEAARETGLVVGEDFLDRARQAELALDDWEDSVLSLKIALSETLLPAVTGVTEAAATHVSTIGNVVRAFQEGKLGLGEYVAMSWDVVYGSQTMADANATLVEKLYGHQSVLDELDPKLENNAGRLNDAAAASSEAAAATGAYDFMIDTAKGSTDDYNKALDEQQKLLQEVNKWTKEYSTSLAYAEAVKYLDADAALFLGAQLGVVDFNTVTLLGRLPQLIAQWDLDKSGKIDNAEETRGFTAAMSALNDELTEADGRETTSHHSHTTEYLYQGVPPEAISESLSIGAHTPYAGGGNYGTGPILTGEDGVELLWPSQGGSVTSNADVRRLIAALEVIAGMGGGGMVNNIYTSQADVDLAFLRAQAGGRR